MVQIAPSILAADFTRLGEQCRTVVEAGAELLHVDVMDGRFVPNLSVGLPVVRSLRKAFDTPLDCHLMIEEPERYAVEFVSAGAAIVTIHQEACRHLHRGLQIIRDAGAGAGVALNPATPIESLDEVLDIVDLVLIMSVNPGFGGQAFLPSAYDRIRRLAEKRNQRGATFRIEVDGGVDSANAAKLAAVGADVLVAGSSVFGTPDAASAVKDLRRRADESRPARA